MAVRGRYATVCPPAVQSSSPLKILDPPLKRNRIIVHSSCEMTRNYSRHNFVSDESAVDLLWYFQVYLAPASCIAFAEVIYLLD